MPVDRKELVGRFCKNEWCSQFFLAKPLQMLCKSCRKKEAVKYESQRTQDYS